MTINPLIFARTNIMKRIVFHSWIASIFIYFAAMCNADFTPGVKQYLENGHIGDYDQLDASNPNYAEFFTYVGQHWREILNAPESIASLGKPMAVYGRVSAAAQQLPPREYIAYCNRMIDLYIEGKIPAEVAADPLSPSARKLNFFEFNWKAAEIQALFRRALKILPVEQDVKSVYQSLLNGDLRESYQFPGNESRPEELTFTPDAGSPRAIDSSVERLTNVQSDSMPVSSTSQQATVEAPSMSPQQRLPMWLWALIISPILFSIAFFWKRRT